MYDHFLDTHTLKVLIENRSLPKCTLYIENVGSQDVQLWLVRTECWRDMQQEWGLLSGSEGYVFGRQLSQLLWGWHSLRRIHLVHLLVAKFIATLVKRRSKFQYLGHGCVATVD